MTNSLAWAVAGLVALVGGAELGRGSRLATRLGISPLVVGFTVVSVRTSAPELAVGVTAALEGSGSLAVDNIAGTNTVNIDGLAMRNTRWGRASTVPTITAARHRRGSPIPGRWRSDRMTSVVLDVLGGASLLLGLGLLTVSVYGVLRLPDTHSQLHAQGLATGPGVIAVLASSVATEDAAIISFCVLGIVFIAFTSPVSSHAIARAARRRDTRQAPR